MILKFQNKKLIELDDVLLMVFRKHDLAIAKVMLSKLKTDEKWNMKKRKWRVIIEEVGLNPDKQKHIFYRVLRRAREAGMIQKEKHDNIYWISDDFFQRMRESSDMWGAFYSR